MQLLRGDGPQAHAGDEVVCSCHAIDHDGASHQAWGGVLTLHPAKRPTPRSCALAHGLLQ